MSLPLSQLFAFRKALVIEALGSYFVVVIGSLSHASDHINRLRFFYVAALTSFHVSVNTAREAGGQGLFDAANCKVLWRTLRTYPLGELLVAKCVLRTSVGTLATYIG